MSIEKFENIAIIGGIVGVGYALWKSGILSTLNTGFSSISSVLKTATSGEIGASIGNTVISKGTTATANTPVTLSELIVTGGNITKLNVAATDNAFAKVGLTTAEVLSIKAKIGESAYNALQTRIINNTLTAADKSLLYANGWDGTCYWWDMNSGLTESEYSDWESLVNLHTAR